MCGGVLQETILRLFQGADYGQILSMTETVEIQFQLSGDAEYPLRYLSHTTM